MTPRPALRLIADDLTGALDTAVEFLPVVGPVLVPCGALPAEPPAALALDAATREGTAAAAGATVATLAAATGFGTADLAFLKLDSLLRGHAAAEIAALWAGGGFDAAVIAPAFPYQGRVTRAGRQHLRDGAAAPVGEDLSAGLRAAGLPVAIRAAGARVAGGLAIHDAETDADLDAVAEAGIAAAAGGARILWCGTGGLAGAIARRLAAAGRGGPTRAPRLAAPILGLFGTDHPVTRGQLDRAGDAALRLAATDADALGEVAARLAAGRAVLVGFDLPALDRGTAARRIAGMLAAVVARLDRPATLVCGGGATLAALGAALGTEALEVTGRIVPGVPVARFRGGRWDGATLVSKSGAFGDPDFLARLIGVLSPPPSMFAVEGSTEP